MKQHECEFEATVIPTYEKMTRSGFIQIRNVPALKCDECGEKGFFPEILRVLDCLADVSMGSDFDFPTSESLTPVEIKAIRDRIRVSQHRFAALVGKSASSVAHWEQGKKQPDGSSLVLLRMLDVLARRPAIPSVIPEQKASECTVKSAMRFLSTEKPSKTVRTWVSGSATAAPFFYGTEWPGAAEAS